MHFAAATSHGARRSSRRDIIPVPLSRALLSRAFVILFRHTLSRLPVAAPRAAERPVFGHETAFWHGLQAFALGRKLATWCFPSEMPSHLSNKEENRANLCQNTVPWPISALGLARSAPPRLLCGNGPRAGRRDGIPALPSRSSVTSCVTMARDNGARDNGTGILSHLAHPALTAEANSVTASPSHCHALLSRFRHVMGRERRRTSPSSRPSHVLAG